MIIHQKVNENEKRKKKKKKNGKQMNKFRKTYHEGLRDSVAPNLHCNEIVAPRVEPERDVELRAERSAFL